jgi:hypothetical protein
MNLTFSKQINLKSFSKTLDLCLITLQTFDVYSYNAFFEELQKNDKDNRLIFIVLNLRLENQMNFFYQNSKKKRNFKILKIQNVRSEDLVEILLILSKILNSKFCKQKLDLIYFYFLPEYSFFSTKIKNKSMQKIKFFEFWILNTTRRFSFFFSKFFSREYTKKIYSYITIIYLQNGLRCLNLYKKI